MPQATEPQRDLMVKWFGDIDIYGPLQFLFSRGYTETGGMIKPPVPDHTVSREESECIDFLFGEWDFAYDDTRAPAYT